MKIHRLNSLLKTVPALLGASLGLTLAHADILGTYNFTGEDGTQASTAANFSAENVAIGAITRGANYGTTKATTFTQDSITFSPNNTYFGSSGYTIADAIAHDGYFEFSVTADSGYTIDVTSITFGAWRASNKSGPNNLALRSSLDNFSSDLATQAIAGTQLDPTEVVFDLDGAITSVTGTVFFRVYGYGRNQTSVSAGILAIGADSFIPFTINGSVSAAPIPEPKSFGLGMGGMAIVIIIGCRRKKIQAV